MAGRSGCRSAARSGGACGGTAEQSAGWLDRADDLCLHPTELVLVYEFVKRTRKTLCNSSSWLVRGWNDDGNGWGKPGSTLDALLAEEGILEEATEHAINTYSPGRWSRRHSICSTVPRPS